MTAQIAENMLYQGKQVAMCTTPLNDYFVMGGYNPRFESNCTALWRGYVGTWEVVDDRLYLTRLHDSLPDSGCGLGFCRPQVACLEYLQDMSGRDIGDPHTADMGEGVLFKRCLPLLGVLG